MNMNKSYMEAQRIFNRCCQTLGVSVWDKNSTRLAQEVAILIADEVLASYPCGCEYDEAEVERKKAYWVDVKYELTKL